MGITFIKSDNPEQQLEFDWLDDFEASEMSDP
jgi:hypothetical protein